MIPSSTFCTGGLGNPAADFYGESRKGDNLYTDSIVALDPDTGKLIWHYQEIPYDVWDWDSAYEIVLVDLEYRGEKRKLLVNPNKGGFTWVLDRTDGKFHQCLALGGQHRLDLGH